MIGQIFAVIQLVLKLIGLWEQFLDYSDKARVAEGQKNTQEREKAVDELEKAETEDEFDKAQSKIIDHKPRP